MSLCGRAVSRVLSLYLHPLNQANFLKRRCRETPIQLAAAAPLPLFPFLVRVPSLHLSSYLLILTRVALPLHPRQPTCMSPATTAARRTLPAQIRFLPDVSHKYHFACGEMLR